MRRCLGAAFAALLLGQALPTPATAQNRGAEPGQFDHYVLSLSWSPSYCATEGAGEASVQCARPYAFLIHGLWPQYHRGFPEFCRTRESDRVPDQLARKYLDIIPSPGLIGHQWRKHGSCTGLGQKAYLERSREAFDAINIPDAFKLPQAPIMVSPSAVEKSFIAANKGLTPEAIAVSCDRRYLREVRICMTKDLAFTPCEEVNRKSCQLDHMLMPPVRVAR